MAHDDGLAEAFALLARELHAESGPEKTHDRVTRAAVEVVDGCDHAAISLIHRRGRIDTVAATGEIPSRVDQIQYATQQGPCLDAIVEHDVYRIDDLAAESRWPDFSRRAFDETGVRSMLAFRLFLAEDTMGALNLYSVHVDAFTERSHVVGALLAAHAAVAMDAAQEKQHAEHLDNALLSNRRIGVAMGILMARGLVTEDQAFDLLRRASQYLNIKLRDIADTVIATGELPGPDTTT